MGANTFENLAKAESAEAAFRYCVEEAQYDFGHAGYTGTIAEKDSFVLINEPKVNSVDEARALANKLIDEGDERIDDKWGPAGCIPCGDNLYLFFGWASS